MLNSEKPCVLKATERLIDSREEDVPRASLLSQLLQSHSAGQRIIGLHGPNGCGKTTTITQWAVGACYKVCNPQMKYALRLELRPGADPLSMQFATILENLSAEKYARAITALRNDTTLDISALTEDCITAFGQPSLLILDDESGIVDCTVFQQDRRLLGLIEQLLLHHDWRLLVTARKPFLWTDDIAWPAITWIDATADEEERNALVAEDRAHLIQDNQQLRLWALSASPYALHLFRRRFPTPDQRQQALSQDVDYTALDTYLRPLDATARTLLALVAILDEPIKDFAFSNLLKFILHLETCPQIIAELRSVSLDDKLSHLCTLGLLMRSEDRHIWLSPIMVEHLRRHSRCVLDTAQQQQMHTYLAKLFHVLGGERLSDEHAKVGSQNEHDWYEMGNDYLRGALRQAMATQDLSLLMVCLERFCDHATKQISAHAYDICLQLQHCLDTLPQDRNSAAMYALRSSLAVGWLSLRLPVPALENMRHAVKETELLGRKEWTGATWSRIAFVYTMQSQWDFALAANYQALEYLEQGEDCSRIGTIWHDIAYIYQQQNKLQAARETAARALKWKMEEHKASADEIVKSWRLMGDICKQQKSWEMALEAYEHALKWQQNTDQPDDDDSIWRKIADLYEVQEQWSDALKAYQKALTRQQRCGRHQDLSSTWQDVGILHEHQQQWQLALEAYQQAVQWCDPQDRTVIPGLLWCSIGRMHQLQKQWQPAVEAYQQAVSRFDQDRHVERLSTAWHQIGRTYHLQQNQEAALAAYQEALVWHQRSGYDQEMSDTWRDIGLLREQSRQWKPALEAYQQAIKYFRRDETESILGLLWYCVGRMHQIQRQEQPALEAYQQAIIRFEHHRCFDRLSCVWHHIGRIYHTRRQWKLAFEAYNKVISYTSNLSSEDQYFVCQAWQQVGIIHQTHDQWDQALEAYDYALAWKASNGQQHEMADTWCLVAMLQVEQWRWETAAQAYLQALYHLGAQSDADIDPNVADVAITGAWRVLAMTKAADSDAMLSRALMELMLFFNQLFATILEQKPY